MKYVVPFLCTLALLFLTACNASDEDNQHLHFVYNFSTQSLDPHRD